MPGDWDASLRLTDHPMEGIGEYRPACLARRGLSHATSARPVNGPAGETSFAVESRWESNLCFGRSTRRPARMARTLARLSSEKRRSEANALVGLIRVELSF